MHFPLKRIVQLICIICFAGSLFSISAFAASLSSPIGYWKTIDDETHQAESVVQITQQGENLKGTVVKLYNNPDAVCTKCTGEMHDKPVMGMVVLWDFTPQDAIWHGKVLAVKRGQIFNGILELINGGNQLKLTVKTAFGSKTQVWERI